MAGSQSAADPSTLPLKETGSGSEAELERGRKATSNAEAAEAYAQGFRLTFTSDQAQRNYAAAKDLFQKALSLDPNYAEAHRGLAYAEFNLGFNREEALKHYKQAIELKPDYGEAHYALAFMYAMDNLEEGAVHFKKALELGVEDERNLGQRFYPTVKIETH
jgi:Tfp pilus assembly protein PilF